MSSSKPEEDQQQTVSTSQVYVVIADGEEDSSNKLELPAASDGTLSMQTLCHAFPGAHGLKYRNKDTGTFRGLMIDNTGSKIYAPPEGWGTQTYLVIFEQTAPQPKASENPKRKMEADGGADVSDMTGGGAKQKRLSSATERKCTDLIVLGLPFKTTSAQLREYFEKLGDVVVCEVKKDHKTGKHKGYGFVQFTAYDTQVKVLAQQEHLIDGRKCQVRIPNSKGEAQEGMKTKLFVGRVTNDMTAVDLRDFFQGEACRRNPEADCVDVFIPKPFRGFAFVTFNDIDVCDDILNTKDFVMNGASICVSRAAPKGPPENLDLRSPGGGRYVYSTGVVPSHVRHNPLSTKGKGPQTSAHYQNNMWPNPNQSEPPPRYGPPGGMGMMGYAGYGGYGYGMGYGPNPNMGYGPPPNMGPPPTSNMGPPGPRESGPRPPYSNTTPGSLNSGAQNTNGTGGTTASGGSNALASGMDALNLNNMNPEAVSAAWQAFWNTLQSQQKGGMPSAAPTSWNTSQSSESPSYSGPPPSMSSSAGYGSSTTVTDYNSQQNTSWK